MQDLEVCGPPQKKQKALPVKVAPLSTGEICTRVPSLISPLEGALERYQVLKDWEMRPPVEEGEVQRRNLKNVKTEHLKNEDLNGIWKI